jgi:pimeloyl-ACP methyl ester carboxylesterase
VDVVGYSMGGLVAREWLRNGGKGRVRRLVFLGTPNEGAPIAFFGVLAANTGVLDQVVGNAAGGELAGALGFLLNDRTSEALTTFLPTYDWATLSLLPGILPPREVPSSELNALLLGTTAPLEALNAVPPDAKAEMHAFFYTSVPTEALGVEIGTIDRVDLTPLVAGLAGGLGGDTLPDLSGVDLAALATGEGDGVVPAHSVRMDGVPAWRDRIVPHDLGAGVHVTLPLDPNVFVQVAAVLTQ